MVAASTSASTSELSDSSSDCTHAAEGFALVELLIEFTLVAVIVSLATVLM
jgi:Tfp pilus assembly protein FimT